MLSSKAEKSELRDKISQDQFDSGLGHLDRSLQDTLQRVEGQVRGLCCLPKHCTKNNVSYARRCIQNGREGVQQGQARGPGCVGVLKNETSLNAPP